MKMYMVMGYITECSFDKLNDKEWLKEKLEEVVHESGFTLISTFMQDFDPQGVTGVSVIGESHLALHTWPEDGTVFAEVVSCSTEEQANQAFDLFAALFPNSKVNKHSVTVTPDTSEVITTD